MGEQMARPRPTDTSLNQDLDPCVAIDAPHLTQKVFTILLTAILFPPLGQN
jgi:hypothetical protein